MLRRLPLLSPAGLLVGAPVLVSGGGAQAAGADELVLPAHVPYLAPDTAATGSGSGSFAWSPSGLQQYGNGSAASVLLAGESRVRVFPHSVAVPDGPVVLLSDTATRTVQVVLDTRDGSRHEVQGGLALRPLSDGGWVSASPLGGVDRHAPDGSVSAHVDGPATYGERQGVVHPTVLADTEGALLVEPADTGASATVRYVDWATGRTDVLTGQRPVVALTDGAYGVADGSTLTRYRRSDGGVQSRRTLAVDALGTVALSLTPDATAWLVPDTPYDSTLPQVSLVTSPESAPATSTRLGTRLPDTGQGLVARDGGFVVQAGYSGAERGYVLVRPGQTALGPALALTGASPPSSLAVENGRVVWTYPHRYAFDYEATEQRIAVGGSGPVLDGPERVAAAGGAYRREVLLSGDLLETPVDLGTTYTSVVLRDGREVGRVGGKGFAHQLAGDDVVFWVSDAGRWSTELRSAVSSVVPARVLDGRCAVQGTTAACVSTDGVVVERDVLTGASRTVTVSPPPPGTGALDVQLDNGEALVSWQDAQYPGRSALRTDVVELASGRTVSVATPHEAARLGGGRLAYVDVDDARAVHLLDLADGTDLVVGQEQTMDVGAALLGLSDRQLVWIDDTARLHVRQLPEPAGRARLLTATPVTSFGRAGLQPRFTTDRPVPPVSLEVRDASGALVVQTLAAAAPFGVLQPRWDGHLADGGQAPGGTYSYALRLPAGVDTGGVPLTGRAVLDLVVPVPQAALPPAVSDGSTSGQRFRLRLGSDDPTAAFDVVVAKRGRQPDRTIGWGAPRSWLRGVPAQSVVYGGIPYGSQPGSLLRFTVTARDPAANAVTRTFDVLSPYDDGASPQRYSAGWGTRTDAAAFGGGMHVTTTPGAQLALRASTNRLVLVGPRCPLCGRFTVSVDGRVVRTVSAAGTAASRVRLVDLHLAGAPALHDVVVRVLGGRVAVDAVGLVA